ncbi:LIV-I protein F [Hartmannibacter diazotrophicus]|uniref:LIV-I protein F n=1 Tax=Hartmannibacter diazotrophicus TaxID=1482074 RepID=A0A2C9D5Z1_9HYPH|nr:ABC transporter ATP-binding protein [Hartmannibacter diazotrophicus]SON55716.1 LIV-I protein F [Hartmannibacter diazotrophicus]
MTDASVGAPSGAAFDISGLSSGYAGALVLREVSLAVRPGKILALLGKNGMGKSTLIRTVMGFVRVEAGHVRVGEDEITGTPPNRLARSGISYAPQEKAIFQDLSIEDNLRLAAPDDRAFKPMLERVCEQFPLFASRLKQKAGTLSGGEQKMLMLSRALMVRPRLLLVDEISEGLQPAVVSRVASILKDECETHGTTILLVEQNIDFALRIAHRWAVLDRGAIADSGVVDGEAHDRIVAHLSI